MAYETGEAHTRPWMYRGKWDHKYKIRDDGLKSTYGYKQGDAPKGFHGNEGAQWVANKETGYFDNRGRFIRTGVEGQTMWHPESAKWADSEKTWKIDQAMDERHRYHAGLKASHEQTSSLLARRAERREGHIQKRALRRASRRMY
tara:strand:+ start:910 stop:1344 length:435 start_codon:yes stop_codon:yes gene_type:complete